MKQAGKPALTSVLPPCLQTTPGNMCLQEQLGPLEPAMTLSTVSPILFSSLLQRQLLYRDDNTQYDLLSTC